MKHWHRFLSDALVAAALAVTLALIAPGGQGSLAADSTFYVDAAATGDNNGSSWEDAYTELQPALDEAATGDQIWVAEGTYKPTAEHGGSGDRYKSFQMENGVALYGGFDPSVGAIGFEDRDWASYVTTISGDIGIEGDDSDNSYHVFYHPAGMGLNSTAILDGFMVTGGNANVDSWPRGYGGGMYNDGSSPAVSNCTFWGNYAIRDGGGMANYASSSPLLTNCTFHDNSASYGGGMWNSDSSPTLTNCTFQDNSANYAGGMWNYLSSSPTLTDCIFLSNDATLDGGGIYTEGGSQTLANCSFVGNSAGREGGGIFNDSTSPKLTNCTFSGNSATTNGGGMLNRDNSSPAMTNCTFWNNSAGYYGGGMYNYNGSSPALTNCILWGDSLDEISNCDLNCTPVVTFSDIQGGYDGEGNIDTNPQFVDPDNGDLHLQAWSPCIDRGDNSAPDLPDLDFEGDDRILDGDDNGTAVVDMGVDEVVGVPRVRIYLPVVLKTH